MFGKRKTIGNCLLDTSEIRRVYLSEDEPNTLIIEAEYKVGSFD